MALSLLPAAACGAETARSSSAVGTASTTPQTAADTTQSTEKTVSATAPPDTQAPPSDTTPTIPPSPPEPVGAPRAVTGDDVRTRVAPSTLVAEGPRRLRRGESVLVRCQANDIGPETAGSVDAGTGVWFLIEGDLWVTAAFVEHQPPLPGSDPGGYFDPTLPVCTASQVPTGTPTTSTTAPTSPAVDCGIIALQGGLGPRVTVEGDSIDCTFATQLMDGLLRDPPPTEADGTWQLGQWTCRPVGTGTECESPVGRIRAV